MKILRKLDKKDYDINLPVNIREGVRAIIIKNGKIAVLKSLKRGEYKLPGGGIDEGETYVDALCREVLEETGLVIKKETIKEFGTLIEKRKDLFCEAIFEQTSHYYLCDAFDNITNVHLSESEFQLGYELAFVNIEDAITNNVELLKKIEDTTYIERETFIYKELIKELIIT